jgi:hypothetical protein
MFDHPVCRCALLGGHVLGAGWTGEQGDTGDGYADERTRIH